jgi:3'-phosphoadenosine 5'-phosphosulfate sulfotransferase (PAPS reductase)/FAD synthetase
MNQKPLVVLWVGGGQDSTALLYKFVFDQDFKRTWLKDDADLVAIMADTGDEYPETYHHVEYLKKFCLEANIDFHFIASDMGFHPRTWQSLGSQMDLNSSIMSVAFPKSCTDKLKITVCYNFLESYLKQRYGYTGTRKRAFYDYHKQFGKLVSIIGFAKGEENRMLVNPQLDLFPEMLKDDRPIYMQNNVEHYYPLIAMGMDRFDCQDYIKSVKMKVPMPSNCMMCPFQSEAEIVYLYRNYPKRWENWVAREKAKLLKNKEKPRNLGVKGEQTLEEFLDVALKKYGHWSNEKLTNHRMTHGHCVKSKI